MRVPSIDGRVTLHTRVPPPLLHDVHLHPHTSVHSKGRRKGMSCLRRNLGGAALELMGRSRGMAPQVSGPNMVFPCPGSTRAGRGSRSRGLPQKDLGPPGTRTLSINTPVSFRADSLNGEGSGEKGGEGRGGGPQGTDKRHQGLQSDCGVEK